MDLKKKRFGASQLKHARTVVTAAGIGMLAAASASAQTYVFNSFDVVGNQRIADGTILNFGGLDAGSRLNIAQLNAAAQAIRASGLFESVDVIPAGGTLRIAVVEYPTINRIAIEGNEAMSDSALLAGVRSTPRRVFTPQQAEADANAIALALAERGRVNAIVTPVIIRRSDNRVDLIFEVSEGAITEVERVSFQGNRSFSDRRLQRVLDTKQAGIFRILVNRDTFTSDQVAADQTLLTDFYRSRGYADFSIENVDVSLTEERDAFLITYNIREGQRFTFANVSVVSEIEGVDPAMFESAIRVRAGQVYSPEPLGRDIERLERLAINSGLRFVSVEPRITRNPRDLSLNVEYALVEGPRVFVERIDIAGNSTTLDRVIRNQFRIAEGDPFTPREIRASADRIRALGFFQNVGVGTRPGSSDSEVIVDVDVVEGPTGSLSFGANYNTDTGFGLVASYSQSNFRGRGQRLEFDVSTAASNRRLSFGFTEPQWLGRDLSAAVDLNWDTTDNQNALYDTDILRFSPTLNFPISETGRMSAYYRFTSAEILDVAAGASQIIKNEAATGRLNTHSLGYNISYDNRRTGLGPDVNLIARFGQEFGFGDTQFIETTTTLGAETKIFGEEMTLRATFDGGYSVYQEGSSRVIDRFALNSRLMRGFEPGGIGPRDAVTGDALGGDAFAVVRLEAEFPLGLPDEYGITGGVFFDYGSVWSVGETYGEAVLYDDFTPRSVVGASIFWTTPLGPLRFNFTEPVDVQARDKTKNFDLTISTSF